MSKSRFPIQIIAFYKLALIIFVSQGLTLSTASLVFIISQASHVTATACAVCSTWISSGVARDLADLR